MHALRHLQRDARIGQLDAPHIFEHRAHQHGRSTGAIDVIVAVEPQQQSVAAEFQQSAAVLIGDKEDRLEAVADRVSDLLGAFPSFARQLLGELRKARDVDDDRGAFGDPASAVRIVDQMLLDSAGYVGPHTLCGSHGPDLRLRIVIRSRRRVRSV